jgi:ribose transport system ATP-binding protein
MTIEPLLELSGLSKAFGGEQALIDAGMELRHGEIHALVGANGSGKSTLVKILAGYHGADGGAIRLAGRELDLASLGGVAGFRFVHQDLALIPEMTVAENLGLQASGGTPLAAIMPRFERREAAALQPLIDSQELPFRATTPVADLSPADRTMVAVLRAFTQSDEPIRLLVLDEVTASLASREVKRVFELIRRLRSSGVSVLFVSHRIEEILTLCDRVTVLRDGRTVAHKSIAETSELDLIRLITGQEPQELYPELPPSRRRAILAAEHIGGGRIDDVSFALHEGEILGLASLDPAESSGVLRLIYGSTQLDEGAVAVDGQHVTRRSDPHTMSGLGVSLVADRLEGGIQPFSVRENLTLNDVGSVVRRWILDPRQERRAAKTLIHDFKISPKDPDALLSVLSGGNQQKTVLAKSMRLDPRVLLLDDPTRGVDVGAKAVIFALIREAAERGLAVLLASTDFEELSGLCHRVLVLKGGHATAVLEQQALTTHNILELCYRGANGGPANGSDQ